MAYSTKIGIPQYVPKGNNISLNDTVNVDNFKKMIDEIEKALSENKITKNEAHYLRLAATRWIKFDYGKVAEYFCSDKCSDEMQKLLQRSAMVLLDVDDALRVGVVNCKKFVEELRKEEVNNHPEDTSDSEAIDRDPYTEKKSPKEEKEQEKNSLSDFFMIQDEDTD